MAYGSPPGVMSRFSRRPAIGARRPGEGLQAARDRMPVHLRDVKLERKGARLLPGDQALLGGRRLRHATAELVARRFAAGAVELVFAAAAAEPIEVAISDGPVACEVSGGVLLQ